MKKKIMCLVAIAAMGLMSGAVYAYTQGFESGEFLTGDMVAPGVFNWGYNSGWGVGYTGVHAIDAMGATGVPQAATGTRYIAIDGTAASDYCLFNLWQTDARMVTATKQKVAYDFYLDPASTASEAFYVYIYGNAVDTPYYGINRWAYLKNIKLVNVGGTWTFSYFNGAGSYANGPACAAGVWHHLEYHFDFSVQAPNKMGAKVTVVLDGNTVVANSNCDSWGCNIDPAQLASESAGNPFRVYWGAFAGGKFYVDNFVYAADPSTLTGTVVPGNYTGDLGMVGIKVQLIQSGSVVQTYKLNLSDTGAFSIPQIPQGTYDIAIQGSNWLRKVYTAQNLNTSTFDLGTINLTSSDCNGSNGVDTADLSIVLANMDQAGD